MKVANVFRRGGRFFVGPLARTTAGVLIGTGGLEALNGDVADQVLGEAVKRAIGASRDGIPHPAPGDWPGINKGFLADVGAKSMSAFMKGACCVGVAKDARTITFEPTRNDGARGGFVDVKERRFEIPAESTAEEVGRAARKALQLAE